MHRDPGDGPGCGSRFGNQNAVSPLRAVKECFSSQAHRCTLWSVAFRAHRGYLIILGVTIIFWEGAVLVPYVSRRSRLDTMGAVAYGNLP